MRKLMMIAIAALALTSCTKEVEVEKIVYVDKVVEDLERVNALQAQVNNLQSQLNSANTDNSSLESQISSLQSQIEELESQLDSALIDLNSSEDEILALEVQISELEDEVELLETEVEALENAQPTQVSFDANWSGDDKVFSGEHFYVYFTIPDNLKKGNILFNNMSLNPDDDDYDAWDVFENINQISTHGNGYKFHGRVFTSQSPFRRKFQIKIIIDGVHYTSSAYTVKIYG